MKAKFLKEIKKDLEIRRKEILEETGENINGDSEYQVENLPDPADLATSESDQSFTIRLKEREAKLLAKIDEALQRIEDKTYGKCEFCGGEIGEGRLKARPVTTLCIKCKEEQEEQERRATL